MLSISWPDRSARILLGPVGCDSTGLHRCADQRSRRSLCRGHDRSRQLISTTACLLDRGHDLRAGHGRGSRGLGRDQSGDRVQHVRVHPPSSPHNISRRRDAVQANGRPHTVVESSSLHAICSVFQPDTNSPLPT